MIYDLRFKWLRNYILDKPRKTMLKTKSIKKEYFNFILWPNWVHFNFQTFFLSNIVLITGLKHFNRFVVKKFICLCNWSELLWKQQMQSFSLLFQCCFQSPFLRIFLFVYVWCYHFTFKLILYHFAINKAKKMWINLWLQL